MTREELDGIVGLWVDAAMRLGERDLKMMGRLVRAQMRRTEALRPAAAPSWRCRSHSRSPRPASICRSQR